MTPLIGGLGIDTLDYSAATTGVTVNLNTGTAHGVGSDTLSGFENIIGSAFADDLTGDSGNNVIRGGPGNDVLEGGAGTDTLDCSDATSGVTVYLDTLEQQEIGGGLGFDWVYGFENAIGSAYADTLSGTNGCQCFHGGGGASDTLNGGCRRRYLCLY